MAFILLILFFFVAFCIVGLVLLQEGKGGGLTGMSTGMDGVMGAKNPLRRWTAYLFVIFVLMCLGINLYFSSGQDDALPAAAQQPPPATSALESMALPAGSLRPESGAADQAAEEPSAETSLAPIPDDVAGAGEKPEAATTPEAGQQVVLDAPVAGEESPAAEVGGENVTEEQISEASSETVAAPEKQDAVEPAHAADESGQAPAEGQAETAEEPAQPAADEVEAAPSSVESAVEPEPAAGSDQPSSEEEATPASGDDEASQERKEAASESASEDEEELKPVLPPPAE